MSTPTWDIEKTAKNAFVINIYHKESTITKDYNFKFLLSFDRHWDNPKSSHEMQIKHLDEVKSLKTFCLDGGDLFCAMQGKYDRRASKSDVRPEHQNGEYLDSLVTTAADFFEPYAECMPVLGLGNHETAILKAHETNLTDRLVHCLKERTSQKVFMGGYSTWIRFRFRFGKTKTIRASKVLWMFHGSGGDAPMSFGTLNVKRQGSIIPDADLVATGHSHNEFVVPLTRARLTRAGRPYLDEQLHVKVPTYKEEYGHGVKGWHVERGAPPKPTGATWISFKPLAPSVKNGLEHNDTTLYIDTERAK